MVSHNNVISSSSASSSNELNERRVQNGSHVHFNEKSSYNNKCNINACIRKSNSTSSDTITGVHKKKYKRSVVVDKEELLRVLHLPQTTASFVLGCSLSTLKRRFYELKDELQMDKWPQFYHEIRHLEIFPYVYPMSLKFILNRNNKRETIIEPSDMQDLLHSFEKHNGTNDLHNTPSNSSSYQTIQYHHHQMEDFGRNVK
ncbi:hypothetical protein ABK040_004494 [Willaertia magna]